MVKEGRRMPCGFGPDIEWIQENCDLVGRLGEWIGRIVRPWLVPYVARRECVPRLNQQARQTDTKAVAIQDGGWARRRWVEVGRKG